MTRLIWLAASLTAFLTLTSGIRPAWEQARLTLDTITQAVRR